MNRGSGYRMTFRSQTNQRFNEAPIHESGKCIHGRGQARNGPRFNEAPIHESGK